MRRPTAVMTVAVMTVVMTGVCATPAAAQTTLPAPVGVPMEYAEDSGVLANPAPAPTIVFSETVHVEGAAWIRVYFGRGTSIPPGSLLRVASDLDAEVQTLDAGALAIWSDSSAYFNGATVTVDLLAAPASTGNRVVIERLDVGLPTQALGDLGECGICVVDDRAPSSEPWAARLFPAGCSSSVYNERSCMITAGHCIGGNMVIQFNVPESQGNCQLINPPVEDQFPVVDFLFEHAGTGDDWAVFIPGPNDDGDLPYERYGGLRPIASSPVGVGDTVVVTGYGVDTNCVRTQTQQTSDGQVCTLSPSLYRFDTDVRGGNSGSGLHHDGELVGVVTHCPCCNTATRVDEIEFATAREAMCPEQYATLPFTDSIDAFDLDPTRWTLNDGAEGNGRGENEPSPTRSINLDATTPGGDVVRSALLDLSGESGILLTYAQEQGGTDDAPEAGDDLIVEFADADGAWVEIARHDGGGPNTTTYEDHEVSLPPAAYHERFAVRFRVTSDEDVSADDWFVDDVCIGLPGACPLPAPCAADLDDDEIVGITDLLELLAAWGPNPGHPADLDGDDEVGITDLLALLATWGPCA